MDTSILTKKEVKTFNEFTPVDSISKRGMGLGTDGRHFKAVGFGD